MINNKISKLPGIVSPALLDNTLNNSNAVSNINSKDASKTNIDNTASFLYSQNGTGLRSSQQLNINWSKFENHCFFQSAEAATNIAFDTIINTFPFDGTKKEYEQFFDKLTGFEKYVYDSWPKNVGYLFFSGTQVTEDTDGTKGTWISVNPYAGGLFPNLAKNKTGDNILVPKSSFSIEMQLFVPSITNDVQTICQYLNGTDSGFILFLTQSSSTSTTNIVFGAVSGTNSLFTSMSLEKGKFSHICATYNKENSYNKLQLFISESLVAESTGTLSFGQFNTANISFLIGSGSQIILEKSYLPVQTFSGAIDDFRFFHSVRTTEQQKLFAKKSIFAEDNLKLYYKFNEPTGTIGASANDRLNRLVLDSSGNSLHGLINSTGFSHALRSTGSISVPLIHEKRQLSPILFPGFIDVIDLNKRLLFTASDYDDSNPNLITKLVPSHYFLEGQAFEGLNEETGSIGDSYGTSLSIPGGGKLGTAQTLSAFLYTIAKFLDELKIFVDGFSSINYVNYNSYDTAPDNFLTLIGKFSGFDLSSFFNDASLAQFVEGENVIDKISTNQYSLREVQNQILKRILTNTHEFIKSKGTLHSIKAFLRAFGINPDNSFRIKEFGGPTIRPLSFAREKRLEPGTILSMSIGSNIISPFLSSSRIEVGFPQSQGTFVHKALFPIHGISNNLSDGLLTSGSWSYEAIYKFPISTKLNHATQSLVQFCTTGSAITNRSGTAAITFNLVAISSSNEFTGSSLKLYGRPGVGGNLQDAPLLSLSFDNINFFNGDKWNVAFGRERNDAIGSIASSSYFLWAARQNNGEIKERFITQSYFNECTSSNFNSLQALLNSSSLDIAGTSAIYATNLNASGTFIRIGSASLTVGTTANDYQFLHNTNLVSDPNARHTIFDGEVSQIRFWSKALKQSEWEEHVLNYRSLGVLDPINKFGFTSNRTGSFEKLRLDVSTNQEEKIADSSGRLRLFDFSQNNMHFSGTNFASGSTPIHTELYSFSIISPDFDEASTTEKVRIRGYNNLDNVLRAPWAQVSPISEIEPNEIPSDDPRFSIEFSIIDALNKDIINIFGTLDSLNNAIGDPTLRFSPDYPQLENLRDVYFNRLSNKINIRAFFELFKWFDSSIGTFIEQLIPAKTKFYGVNYVIENSMLEKPKIEYYDFNAYLDENQKTILNKTDLAAIEGAAKKY